MEAEVQCKSFAAGSGALPTLDELGIQRRYLPEFDLYVIDAAEPIAKLAAAALDSSVKNPYRGFG